MWADTRGLANGIIGFVVIIVTVALLYTLMDPAFTGVIDAVSTQTTDPEAQAAVNQSATIWGYMPIFGMFLAGLFVLARATFESGGPR